VTSVSIKEREDVRRVILARLGRVPQWLDIRPAVRMHCFVVDTQFSVVGGVVRIVVDTACESVEILDGSVDPQPEPTPTRRTHGTT
jgi:hypothetical protein